MDRLATPEIVLRCLAVMTADPQSPLHRDERTALICWLADVPCDVLILLPEDVLPTLIRYIAEQHPHLCQELSAALHDVDDLLPPTPGFDSPREETFWKEWVAQALDLTFPLARQFTIKDGKYRLDFAYPPLRVGVELDGYTYHSDRLKFTEDRQRQREIEAQGWRILRFSGDEVLANPQRCVQEVAYFLSLQMHRQRETFLEDLPNPFFDGAGTTESQSED